MDRRQFIGTGAVSAATVLAGTACAPGMRLTSRRPNEMPPDMDAYLARIDAGMARLGRWSAADVVSSRVADQDPANTLARSGLQSLFLTGMVGDLPLEAQTHPGVQERIARAMPTMDATADGMTAFLRGRTAEDLTMVQKALRDYGTGHRILRALDDEAGALGMSAWRREQTRAIYSNIEWRLRTQPPALVVGETVEKVERLVASDVPAAAGKQALAARLAEGSFWAVGAPQSKRQARITRGAVVMGIGVVTFAVGAAAASANIDMVFIATAGAILVLVGFVILLVGLGTSSPSPSDSTKTNRP